MRLSPLILLLLFLASCASTGETPPNSFTAPEILDLRAARVAVLPFDNRSGFIGADWFVTDEFNLQIGRLGHFDLVERIRVEDLYREQDFDPSRVDQSTAVEIGRMLGAHAVLLGTVTDYVPSDRSPKLPPTAYPVVIPTDDEKDDYETAALANLLIALFMTASQRPPVCEVGATVRIVSVETGQILWQSSEHYRGNEYRLARRVSRYDRRRLRRDIEYLTRFLASDMVDTLGEGLDEAEEERSEG